MSLSLPPNKIAWILFKPCLDIYVKASTRLLCLHDLWHGTSCWKILLSSKSYIKLSFSSWIYLALFKLMSILTNFLELSFFFMYSKSIELHFIKAPNFTVFSYIMWFISLSCRPSGNFLLIECKNTLVSLLNMILFSAFPTHNSYLIDQLNLVFKYYSFSNTDFLPEMLLSIHVHKEGVYSYIY